MQSLVVLMVRCLKGFLIVFHEVWLILKIAYEGTNTMKKSKLQMPTTNFEIFIVQGNETIGEFYSNLCDFSNQAFSLGNEYSNSKLVRKVLRSLHKRFAIKISIIEEAKDIGRLHIDELIDLLQTFEMILDGLKKSKANSDKSIVSQVNDVVPNATDSIMIENL